MIICLCHRVSDRDIASAASAGCHSFDELQDETRVGTACGACLCCARETFTELAKTRRKLAQATRPAGRCAGHAAHAPAGLAASPSPCAA